MLKERSINLKHCALFVFLTIGWVCCLNAQTKKPFGVKTVCIDAGHGGSDPGCIGITKTYEKDVTLATALKLGNYIEQNFKDVKVIYTRTTDVSVELKERPEIANRNKADLFISIHCNSASYKDKKTKKIIANPDAHGAETYVMGIKNEKGKLDVAKRENSAMLLEDDYLKKYDGFDPNSDEAYIVMSLFADTYLDQSLNLSAKIQEQYKTIAGRTDKGVKRASLWVLWRTAMPSLLTEIGFLTNAQEEKFLCSEKGQDYIALSIFKAFRHYKNEMEGTKITYTDEFEKTEPYVAPKDCTNVEMPDPNKKDSTQTVKPEPKDTVKPKEPENPEVKQPIKINGKSIVFRVQIAVSENQLPVTSDKFKGAENVYEYYENMKYKYASGEFATVEDAAKLQKELRKTNFPDAFVIAFNGDKKITVEEAKKLLK